MKNLLFICIVSFSSLKATAIQTWFRVKTEAGSIVPGAEVRLNGKPVGVTDANGMIALKDLRKGDNVIFYGGNQYVPFEYIVAEQNPKTVQEIVLIPYSIPPTEIDINSPPMEVSFPEPDALPQQDNEIYTIVDELAEFPGGTVAMSKYISNKMVYPAIAAEKNLQGKCFLQFVVEEDGSITNIKVLRGVPDCPEFDMEAVRIVKSMPKWKPGKIQGRAVRSYYTLPVAFKLN